jgi:metallo-beta-lactamase class B
LLLGLVLAVSLAGTASDANLQRLAPDLTVEPVAPGVWRHVSTKSLPDYGDVPANTLIVVGEESAALIDTPWTDEQTALLFGFVEQELGARVAHVVATHSHGDCMGGLAEAHERGAASYALQLTAEYAKSAGNPVPRITFTRDYKVSLGGTDVELRFLGVGHTRDNIVAWIPQKRLLFGGCLVKRDGGSPGYTAEADLAAWPTTLRRVKAAYPDATIVVPGHGAPGTVEYLDYTLELIQTLSE